MHQINVKSVAQTAFNKAVEALFPSSCVHCDTDGTLLCESCVASVLRLDQSVCRRCARVTLGPNLCDICADSPPPLSSLTAIFQFDGAIRDAVHALKYEDIRALAPILGKLMAEEPRVGRLYADAVVPVPLHPKRERRRGYNQASLLAKQIADSKEIRVAQKTLIRTFDNEPQVETESEKDRASNVSGIFEASQTAEGLRLLLVDDVATTGSTLNECARTLLGAGASRVDAVVLAKEL